MVRQHVDHGRARTDSMTAPNRQSDLSRLVAQASGILLDFDGPVCHVFAGLPAKQAADQLRHALNEVGARLPETIEHTADPMELLRFSATLGPEAVRRIDASFRSLEVTAVQSAEPTRHAHDAIRACHQSGRRLAVVSNNAQEAVETYLTTHGLTAWVDAVVGRPFAAPQQMKPDTYLLRLAVETLGEQPERCLMIGDSTTDMISANAIGVHRVGYANKPRKREALAEAGADFIIASMAQLQDALLEQPSST
jgi:HAD superfamily hydrolase (TIGR01509 family)